MEFGKSVHFAILNHCLPTQFTAFPSAHDLSCHADCNIHEQYLLAPLQAEGN
jgi:hypothetical protein